jgi:iron complex transport system ATP-binding protein
MIKIESLTFSRPTKTILSDFNAEIHSNSLTLLSGPNGSGKSTLINLIGGILKPDTGSISINSLDIAKQSTAEQSLLRSIAPQRRIFDLAFSVEEILSIIPGHQRSSHEHDVREALELDALSDLKVTELSLGQQQRVSVALALIQEAPFYLLDEPLSAQDSAHTVRIFDLFTQLSKEHGIVVVAHNSEAFAGRFTASLSVS